MNWELEGRRFIGFWLMRHRSPDGKALAQKPIDVHRHQQIVGSPGHFRCDGQSVQEGGKASHMGGSTTPVILMVDQLPPEARWWVTRLSPAARTEIDRLLKETGVEAFTIHWHDHRDQLDSLENSFDTRL